MLKVKIEKKLGQRLKAHIIGQDEAVNAVSRGVCRSSTALKNPNRPLASFLFSGPIGVGKTLLAKALAIEFFGSKQSLVRIDLTDDKQKHFTSQLSEAIRRKPNSVVLFHHIENARPRVVDTHLQIIDDGTLTDENGQEVCFGQAIVILTRSITEYEHQVPNSRKDAEARKRLHLSRNLVPLFRTEIIYRIDEIVLFGNLREAEVVEVVDVMVKELVERTWSAKEVHVKLTNRLKNKVAEEGTRDIGLCNVKWAFAQLVEDQLADLFLQGRVQCGNSVSLGFDPSYARLFTPVGHIFDSSLYS